jgi:hypothetical protein
MEGRPGDQRSAWRQISVLIVGEEATGYLC